MVPMALFSEGATALAANTDLTATTTVAVNLVTSVLGLFEVYPLNIILTFVLCSYAFKFFGRGRKAAAGGI